MDFQLPKCLYCPICYEVYDEQSRIPIIIPCGNGHTICATCIVNTWGEDGRFVCPFDKVELYYYNGIVNELAKNRVVLDALEELKKDYCSQHPSRKLDLICNTCQTSICSACQLRGSHEGHDVVLVEEFDEEVAKSSKIIKKYMSEIENIFEKIIHIVNHRQTELHEMINTKFHQYAERLKNARDFMKKQIEQHFSKMKEEIHSNVLVQGPETKQILAWKMKVKEMTNKNSRKKSMNDDFEIIKQNKMASSLEIENWLNEKKQNIEQLEKRLDEMWIEFQKEFESNIHGTQELEDKYDSFMDTIHNEIGLEGKSPGLRPPRNDVLGYDDEAESPQIMQTKSKNVVKTGKEFNITIQKTSQNQGVKEYHRFVQQKRSRSTSKKISKLQI